jgi:hypothetical protein
MVLRVDGVCLLPALHLLSLFCESRRAHVSSILKKIHCAESDLSFYYK